MRKRAIKHHLEGLLVLLMFGVLAACVLSVLLTGADAYRRLTERDAASYDRRTAVQYVATKVRQADRAGAVAVEDFGGVQALVLSEELEGETYLTRVYCYEGCLRELFSAESAELAPEDGEKLLETETASFVLADGLLTVQLESREGDRETLLLSLRSGEGAAA